MIPTPQDIEKVGNAFISIGYLDYTPEQHEYLIRFLQEYGKNLNEQNLIKLFNGNQEIMQAIKTLHHYSDKFSQDEMHREFREEMDELIITLNGKDDSISI